MKINESEVYQVYYTTPDEKGEEYEGKFKNITASTPLEAMYIFQRNHPDYEIVAVI